MMMQKTDSASDVAPGHRSISKLSATFNALVILGILALAGAAWFAIDQLRVGGPLYERIVNGKNLVADVLPPPLYVIEAYHEVTRLKDAPHELERRVERLQSLHADYRNRHAYWNGSNYTLTVRRKLTVDSDREVQRFWAEIEGVYVPALRNGDHLGARESYDRISVAYDAHRKIVDEIVEAANADAREIESAAERQKDLFLLFVAGATIVSLYLAALALRLLHTRVIRPLIALSDYISASGSVETGAASPFLSRQDEIGVMARAVESFRSNVERRVLEAKNIQLDAALNNIIQGIEMYDAHGALALSNARFRQIYMLSEDEARPGVTLHEAIKFRVDSKLLSEEAGEKLLERTMRGLTDPELREFNCHLADGRCISISVQPIPDGSGFVATHEDVTEQRRFEARIAFYAHHDALTGLPNRIRLNDELDKALTYVRRGEVVAIHIIDLDNFKTVNDTLGHPVGDKLLVEVAGRLREQVSETDTLARMGGDEFAIVERQISEPGRAVSLARRITQAIADPFEIDGHRINIGTSIGIAVGPIDGSCAEDLMRNADLALYHAKDDGRGTFRFFEPGMDAELQARSQLERELREAITTSQFELHYQPVVGVDTGEIRGFEALLRWRHPERGLVPPSVFIPLAEETRLIVPIGEWVLREACKDASRWPDETTIAVNLSAVQFRQGNIRQAVAEALAGAGLAPRRLELEITESVLLEGNDATLATLHHLRDLGVRIAMDDFGTGYSSLSYLQSFPFDKIKIDKSFIQGIDEDAASLNIVRAVTTLANGLGIKTTAEGVESEAQLEAVRSEGCTEIQGFFMSRPMVASDVDELLRLQGFGRVRQRSETAA